MPAPSSLHLMTGATGFVGAALALELLASSNDQLVCIVRAEGVGAARTEAAQQRLHALLQRLVAAYDYPPVLAAQIPLRVRALPGDVSQPLCGLAQADIDALQGAAFWHAAASLRYEDRHAKEIFATNVEGGRHAIALASALGASEFNAISTAYVCGNRNGVIEEARRPPQGVNNLYEQSKIDYEGMLHQPLPFAVRIFRPSIVIGHSRTHAAMNFSGMYGFIRQLHAFRRMLQRTQPGLLEREPLRLRADVGTVLDLVPVDKVVQAAVQFRQATAIGSNNAPQPGQPLVFHLNNPTPPLLDEVLAVIFDLCELPMPELLRSDADKTRMRWLDEKFNQRIEFYRAQFYGRKIFARQQAARFLPHEEMDGYRLDAPRLRAFCSWYLQALETELAATARPSLR